MLGGGAGHIMDMISRLKANDAMRRKRSYFKIKKDYLDTAKGMKIIYREATNEELETIRSKIKYRKKREDIKLIINLFFLLF